MSTGPRVSVSRKSALRPSIIWLGFAVKPILLLGMVLAASRLKGVTELAPTVTR
jgi:hypothetical protein